MSPRNCRAGALCALFILALTLKIESAGAVEVVDGRLYVKADAAGANTGASWQDAYTSLGDALRRAEGLRGIVREIWVAQGTYTPAAAGGDRRASFALAPGVAVYGGFAGGETSYAQRNPAARPTILSGDLNGDDATGKFTDNSLHVVVAKAAPGGGALDGFIVRGGYADGAGEDARGAGVWIRGVALSLINCTITENRTATRPNNGPPESADGGDGAGVYISGGAQARLLRCVVRANRTGDGGLVQIADGGPTQFYWGNGGSGAGIACRDSSLTLTACTVEGNVTGRGGTIETTALKRATGHGGNGAGVHLTRSVLLASKSRLSGNTTGGGWASNRGGDSARGGYGGSGAGLFATSSTATLVDCALTRNATGAGGNGINAGAGGGGAGIWFELGAGALRLTRCTLGGNVTGSGGGSLFHPGAGGDGGGLAVALGEAALAQCIVNSNATGGGGADISEAQWADGGAGGGVWCSTSTLTLDRTAIVKNRTGKGSQNYYLAGDGGDGAGLYCADSLGTLTNCVIHSNRAGDGGAGVASGLNPRNMFPGTGGAGGDGGGMALIGSPLLVRGCTVAFNRAGAGGNKAPTEGRVAGRDGLGGGIFVSGKAPTLLDVIVWGNQTFAGQDEAAQLSGPARVSYSLVQGWTGARGGVGNSGANPLFVSPDTLNLRLRPGSPAIDAGRRMRDVAVDYDGARRPYNGDGLRPRKGDGSEYDIGAYEFHGARVGR